MANIQHLTPLLFLVFLLFFAVAKADNAPTIDQECATEASKLTECVGYASGEEAVPTGKCCGSVSDLKAKDPSCLCLVIRQAHDGGSGGFSALHLHLDRLLSLPKACALANASISYCPRLLNIPPSSPDYALFTNASYANSSSTTSATIQSPSGAVLNLNNYSASLMVALSAIFSIFFQIGA